jgi:putative FmdB family regulatory protein
MKKINDYRCTACDFIFEDLEENTCSCPECSNLAKKIMTPVRFHLDGASGDFPTAADRWAKDHEKAAKHRQGREDWQ